MAFLVVLRADRRLERLFVGVAPRGAFRFDRVAPYRRENGCRLLAAHHRYARIGPHPQKARVERASAHPIVSGAVAAADDDSKFRDLRARNSRDHLRAVFSDTARLILPPDHEPRDVLQEHERNAALTAQLDKVRAFLRRLRIENAIVGDDADRISPDARKARHQRRSIARLEFIELARVDDAGDHLSYV